MKHLKSLLAAILLIPFFVAGPQLHAQITNSIPSELRARNFTCDKATIQTAIAIRHAGWTYIMPQPKSPQAAWGNRDGRTTWWIGYWINGKNDATSLTQPIAKADSQWVGDGKGGHIWRRGGSPPPPSKIEWLCSTHGGIPPE
jgi:hypothetical protein